MTTRFGSDATTPARGDARTRERAPESAGRALGGASSWTAAKLASSAKWLLGFDEAQRDEIRSATARFIASGMPPASIGRDDFPLPATAGALADARDRLERGAGALVLRGVPLEGLPIPQVRAMFWGVCLHLGTPIPQNGMGDLIGDVRVAAGTPAESMGRWYASPVRLTFHTDRCDVLALMVVRTARHGGLSRMASSVAIHDALAASHPDLLELLYEPFTWRVPERHPTSPEPFFRQPVMSVVDGRLSCVYNRFQIEAGHRHPRATRLTAAQTEALDAFEALAESDRYCHEVMLEPGDVQLLNNHIVLHARTAYEDDEGADTRHLLRIWLAMVDSRPLDPRARANFRDCRAGAVRGGYPVKARIRFEDEA